MSRWILPVAGALALHAALFAMDPGFTRPVLMLPESKAVTISLLATPPAPAAPPAVKPKPAPPVKTPPKKKRIAAPRPQPAIAPPPLPAPPAPPEPASPEPVLPEAAPMEEAVSPPDQKAPPPDQAAESETTPSDQARIQASVPLYHLNPPPAYPAVARRRNYQGTTLLDVLVDRQGRAAQVRVRQSSGFSILDRSAVAAVRQWRFEPARRMGQAMEMWVQVPVKFELK